MTTGKFGLLWVDWLLLATIAGLVVQLSLGAIALVPECKCASSMLYNKAATPTRWQWMSITCSICRENMTRAANGRSLCSCMVRASGGKTQTSCVGWDRHGRPTRVDSFRLSFFLHNAQRIHIGSRKASSS